MSSERLYTQIIDHLLSSTGVTSRVGTRVRPFESLPQLTDFPAVAVTVVGAERPQRAYASDAGHVQYSVQADSFASGKLDSIRLADAVRSSLQWLLGGSGSTVVPNVRACVIDSEFHLYDAESRAHRVMQQYTVHLEE